MDDFSADFYAAVITIGLGLVVAKFVAHRVSSDRHREDARVARLHVACVAASILAVLVALVGIELESNAWGWHLASWVLLLVAGGALLWDLRLEDLAALRRR
jgi:hypothetical protein